MSLYSSCLFAIRKFWGLFLYFPDIIFWIFFNKFSADYNYFRKTVGFLEFFAGFSKVEVSCAVVAPYSLESLFWGPHFLVFRSCMRCGFVWLGVKCAEVPFFGMKRRFWVERSGDFRYFKVILRSIILALVKMASYPNFLLILVLTPKSSWEKQIQT